MPERFVTARTFKVFDRKVHVVCVSLQITRLREVFTTKRTFIRLITVDNPLVISECD